LDGWCGCVSVFMLIVVAYEFCKGVVFGVGVYLIWGVFLLYFCAFELVGVVEIVVYCVVWLLVVCLLLFVVIC